MAGRLNLSGDALKQLAMRHAEKAVFGLIICGGAVLFAWGYKVDSAGESRRPSELQALAKQCESYIQRQDVWELLKPERMPPLDHPVRVEKGREPVQVAQYAMPVPWTPFIQFHKEKRPDPELFAPAKPETTVMAAAVGLKPSDRIRDLLSLEPLALANKDKKKTTTSPRTSRAPRRPVFSGGDEEEEMEFEEGDEGSDFDAPAYSQPGGQYRSVSDAFREKVRNHYEYLYEMKTVSQSSRNVAVRGYYLVSVKALVPWQKQWQEFKSKLETTMGYNPERDQPDYIFFEVERAEVSGSDDAPSGKLLTHTKHYQDVLMSFWADKCHELYDPIFTDAELTMPIPAVFLCNYARLAVHSAIPLPKKTLKAPSDKPAEEKPPSLYHRRSCCGRAVPASLERCPARPGLVHGCRCQVTVAVAKAVMKKWKRKRKRWRMKETKKGKVKNTAPQAVAR